MRASKNGSTTGYDQGHGAGLSQPIHKDCSEKELSLLDSLILMLLIYTAAHNIS